jgi:hypothetical protein
MQDNAGRTQNVTPFIVEELEDLAQQLANYAEGYRDPKFHFVTLTKHEFIRLFATAYDGARRAPRPKA